MRKDDDLTTFIVPKVEKIRSFILPDPQGPLLPVEGKLKNYVENFAKKVVKCILNRLVNVTNSYVVHRMVSEPN